MNNEKKKLKNIKNIIKKEIIKSQIKKTNGC